MKCICFVILAWVVRLDAKPILAGTAALIGGEVIPVSEAYFRRAVRNSQEGVRLNFEPVEADVLKKTVSRVLFEMMVTSEIKGLKVPMSLKPKAIQKWGDIKKKEAHWKEMLSRYDKSENDVIAAIWQFLEVEAFVEKKVETFTPIITDAEVERYYQQNMAKNFPDSLENQRPGIRTLLQKSRVEKSLEEWIRFLREKYAVVNLLGAG